MKRNERGCSRAPTPKRGRYAGNWQGKDESDDFAAACKPMKRLFERLSECKDSLSKERNYSERVKAEREDLKIQLEKLKKDHEAWELLDAFKTIFRARELCFF